ncbi:2-amino-4-hydroxy-6-hydroxymethyldihydropteridine diphosphokinase [Aerococcus agrisoli]|uniref:2-amino-4-hydroxy-6-hydroxymethyldihydropteridine diphosphokinase n=1 Tax=Aerococcus agrisoli TaxID=2487350 RepID=A0A3N4GF40_9LACT|nr:2-amino-4-hydroxy-6-hydroxymethyldihydropteridine diphosphokinase [Aerococcus agrisoli]RPA60498.1 2-amino-4-hydroxy-6-hydroxymethyldihydropteridine diphosphokinase [Aerococcus agrisoli]
MLHQALIALGSNIEPKVDHLRNAIQAFKAAEGIQVTAVSSVYETVPRGYADQDNFYNMVLQIETDLDPETLLAFCQSIETMEKRVRLFKNGPRTIDVDILLVDDLTLTDPDLLVPHPRMHERGFVLIPTAEIAGDWEVPGFEGATIADLTAALPQVERDDVRISDRQL